VPVPTDSTGVVMIGLLDWLSPVMLDGAGIVDTEGGLLPLLVMTAAVQVRV